jgi:hypothetical protein
MCTNMHSFSFPRTGPPSHVPSTQVLRDFHPISTKLVFPGKGRKRVASGDYFYQVRGEGFRVLLVYLILVLLF